MAKESERTEAGMPRKADAAPAPGEPLPLPLTAAALAGKAKDLQALRDAVVDAANVGAGLWFSYLFVLFYLLIAVGGVTHRDLFLESPVKLPFLNVDLPLLGFFVLGPLIFLVVHTYVLLHFVLLAGKVGNFDAELRVQITDDEVRKRLRRQLPSNIFVQFLAGSREVRSGIMGFLLRLIAQISLVLGPIALLVFFQLQFLPYHNEAISWWHRIAVAADIALLWILWPSVARGERAGISWRDLRHVKILALVLASLAPFLLVTAIATFPGEWLDNNLWKDGTNKSWRRHLASMHELLVAGEVDFAARKPKSLWSNRLVLPGFDAIDHSKFDSEAKIEVLSETISLRARHLEGAVLIGAKLRKADFTAAQLQAGQFTKADFRGAKFDCGSFPKQCAQLDGARLNHAQFQGASLEGAQLQGANLFKAQLQGASLVSAQFQGAMLNRARLQGASLFKAQLQGASLIGAQLQGASLKQAQLQGAMLNHAQLQGAWLQGARLQGAQLAFAQLQGASLDNAQLQGASLHEAQLHGASLAKVFAWRANARTAVWKDTRVDGAETGLKRQCSGDNEPSACDWSAKSFDELERLITVQVPEGDSRREALERIRTLDPAETLKGEDENAKVWQAQAFSSPTTEVYEKYLAEIWQKTGCAAEGAPYVLRMLLFRLNLSSSFGNQSQQPSVLAAAFLDEEHCPGAHGLTDSEKAKLKEIRDHSPPAVREQ